jgi:cytoskeletal protein CcmA (bactofilin family)
VIIEDLKISGYTAVSRLATCGRIEVTKKGRLVATVRAGELIVKGTVSGEVLAIGKAEVQRTGRLEGPLRARTLAVRLGGTVNGPCQVGDDAVPEVPPDGP